MSSAGGRRRFALEGLVARGYRAVRRVVVGVVGTTVVLLGVLMLVLPGPALIVIPAGLAILALEFRWARRLLARAREQSDQIWEGLRGASGGTGEVPAPGPDEDPPPGPKR